MSNRAFDLEQRQEARSLRWLVLALVISGAAITVFNFWSVTPITAFVTVVGDVPYPGVYEAKTVGEALSTAGIESSDPRPIDSGSTLTVSEGRIDIRQAEIPQLVGLPIDINQHGPRAFDSIPGVSKSVAQAIVADRQLRGEFFTVDDLLRVSGVGPSTLDRIRPFVELKTSIPVHLNTASAPRLTTLPGIGDALSERIVADRQRNGRYESLEDVTRVQGIGPALVMRWGQRATTKEEL